MSSENPAKKLVRKVLKGKVLRTVEDEYRLARASYANARFNWPAKGMRVIMITGTNGKTTTAHFLFSILRTAGYSVGLSSTAEFRINDQVEANTTNMTVIDPVKLRRELASFKAHKVDFVILEATSQALDQHRLWGIPCEVAIMTNLTQDHLDYHKTMKNYAKAKSKLWALEPKYSILNQDDEWFEYFYKKATGKKLTYGSKADIQFADYRVEGSHSKFTLELPTGKSVVKMLLGGKYNVYNALAAATAAYALKVSAEHIEEGIEALEGISGRLQPVVTHKGFKVLVDYAHTPDGLEKVLGAVQDMSKGNLWLVFGACGDRDQSKRPIMGKIAGRLADKIVVTDEESYSEDPEAIRTAIVEGVKKARGGEAKMIEIADRKAAIKHALDNAKKGDLVLITGLGHEQYRVEQGKKVKWNDANVVQKLLTISKK